MNLVDRVADRVVDRVADLDRVVRGGDHVVLVLGGGHANLGGEGGDPVDGKLVVEKISTRRAFNHLKYPLLSFFHMTGSVSQMG